MRPAFLLTQPGGPRRVYSIFYHRKEALKPILFFVIRFVKTTGALRAKLQFFTFS